MIIGSDSMAKEVVTEVVEEGKNKKLHNYLILLLIFVVSIIVVLYVCQLYKVEKDAEQKIPVIRSSIKNEILPDELEHYVRDNSRFVIYMCTANDDRCRTFEKDFKRLLSSKKAKNANYTDAIVYLNLTDSDQQEFVDTFNSKYPYRNGITEYYPAFVLFEDGKVKNILQASKNKSLTISKVSSFLELNDIGE